MSEKLVDPNRITKDDLLDALVSEVGSTDFMLRDTTCAAMLEVIIAKVKRRKRLDRISQVIQSLRDDEIPELLEVTNRPDYTHIPLDQTNIEAFYAELREKEVERVKRWNEKFGASLGTLREPLEALPIEGQVGAGMEALAAGAGPIFAVPGTTNIEVPSSLARAVERITSNPEALELLTAQLEELNTPGGLAAVRARRAQRTSESGDGGR